MLVMAADHYGEPSVLHAADWNVPKVGPDSVLVRVAGAGVNPVDWKMVAGRLDPAFDTYFPFVPGWDVSGVVEQVGPAVEHIGVGDRVIAYARKHYVQHGCYAELAAVPAAFCSPAPTSVELSGAAALPLAGLTAYQALVEALEVKPHETVLVHAAAGGVGSFAVQLALAHGARVVGTAGIQHREHVQRLGATWLDYHTDGLAEALRDTLGRGADAVVDLVGGETLRSSPGLLEPGGRIASVTDASEVRQLGGRYLFVRPDGEQLHLLARWVDEGRLRIHVSETFALTDAAAALRQQQDGHVTGKLVLRVDSDL